MRSAWRQDENLICGLRRKALFPLRLPVACVLTGPNSALLGSSAADRPVNCRVANPDWRGPSEEAVTKNRSETRDFCRFRPRPPADTNSPVFRVDGPFCRPLQFSSSSQSRYFGRLLAPMTEGYCVKCKTRKEITNGVEETMKNGRRAIKGRCITCGTVMFKILGGKAAVPVPGAADAPPGAPGK